MRPFAVLSAAVAALALAPSAAAGPAPVAYRPPVHAPVVDTFRSPASAFGPGNRGIDYATPAGQVVRAAAAGQVAFAGPVGGSSHVVVLHPDGVRTSYSFLAAVRVGRGDRVDAGQPLGVTRGALHFGARVGDAYLDPLVLLQDSGRPRVRLVPDGAPAMAPEAAERGRLQQLLRALPGPGAGVGGAAVGWARRATGAALARAPGAEEVQAWLRMGGPLVGPPWAGLPVAAAAWWQRRATCTPPAVAPTRPPGRRLAVLVAGLGSRSDHAAVAGVDTAALGYGEADVVRFSYRGGTTAERAYTAADTQVDLRVSGRRLRALLERLRRAHPAVPIDVVAHSQGGLVARAALARPGPPPVATVVTLGTPHQGAHLATTLAHTAHSARGAAAQAAAGRVRPVGLDPGSASVRQLAAGSAFLRRLNAEPLPAGVRFTSIAARADAVVVSPRTWLAGAANVVVPVPAVDQHGELPRAPAATREIALAVAGQAPTCETLGDALADAATGAAMAQAEDLAAATVAQTAR